MKGIVTIALAIVLAPTALFGGDLPGINFNFNPAPATGNSMTYNPQYGASYNFNNGVGGTNTMYPDGSWSYQIGGGDSQGQSITIDNRDPGGYQIDRNE